MEIFNIKIEEALKFPFEKKDWASTLGIYFLISLCTSFLTLVFFFSFFFGGIIFLETAEKLTNLPWTLIIILAIPLNIILFLIQIYLQGYIVEMIRNIKEQKEQKAPKHHDIPLKLRFGFAQFVLGLGPIIFTTILFLLSTAVLITGIILLKDPSFLSILLMIFGIITVLISIMLFMFVAIMVLPSMLYIYLETGSIRKAYCCKNVKKIIQNAWQEFLVIYTIGALGSMLVFTIGQIPGFGFLLLTFGIAYIVFVVAFFTGKIFTNIDKLKLVK